MTLERRFAKIIHINAHLITLSAEKSGIILSRACLHEGGRGGGPRIGEVTPLGGVKK